MTIALRAATAASNTGRTVVAGLLELTITRSGGSRPGTLEAIVAASQDVDAGGSLERFYPYLELDVIESETPNSPGGVDRLLFSGRIDEAKQTEDERYGRIWRITARDYLSVLADNYVGTGKWQSAGLPARGTAHAVGDAWHPNYVGDYDGLGGAPGEYRRNIIADLALNVIASPTLGISTVDFVQVPNSKRVEANFEANVNLSVLDAIRDLAEVDPWCTSCGAEVDAKALTQAGFPADSGIGAEFQMGYLIVSSDPRAAIYYRRGATDSQMRLTYGPPGPLTNLPIISYNFDKQGADIFSRARTSGRGEAVYRRDTGTVGTGVTVPGMETTWNPLGGLFRVRREMPTRAEWETGDWLREDQTDEVDAIRARALRDRAYGVLLSGGQGLSALRGGPNQGRVTIPGLPAATATGAYALPGDKLILEIPQLKISGEFIIKYWQYRWPDSQTTLEVARRSYADIGERLIEEVRRSNDAQSAANDFYDTGWVLSSSLANAWAIRHALGVKPSRVTLEAAVGAGVTIDGKLIPKKDTEVEVQSTAYEASQGQNHGYAVIKRSPEDVSIRLAHWLAYSDGAARWLKSDDGDVVIRARISP